mmetsp:Transcript_4558/g.8843  ORF Transcript_4558/g.8843 Transcript_4558/m.8843 type:complete len:367 (+) Transcript_4558:1081-2181(+)
MVSVFAGHSLDAVIGVIARIGIVIQQQIDTLVDAANFSDRRRDAKLPPASFGHGRFRKSLVPHRRRGSVSDAGVVDVRHGHDVGFREQRQLGDFARRSRSQRARNRDADPFRRRRRVANAVRIVARVAAGHRLDARAAGTAGSVGRSLHRSTRIHSDDIETLRTFHDIAERRSSPPTHTGFRDRFDHGRLSRNAECMVQKASPPTDDGRLGRFVPHRLRRGIPRARVFDLGELRDVRLREARRRHRHRHHHRTRIGLERLPGRRSRDGHARRRRIRAMRRPRILRADVAPDESSSAAVVRDDGSPSAADDDDVRESERGNVLVLVRRSPVVVVVVVDAGNDDDGGHGSGRRRRIVVRAPAPLDGSR